MTPFDGAHETPDREGKFAERACGTGSFRALEAETQPRR
jgi:hypothetical protein